MPTVILAVHITVSILLILIILMQSSQENELSGLFMGGGGQPLFGPRAGNILTRITTVLAIGFILTSLTLTLLSARRPRRIIDKVLAEEKKEVSPETRPISPDNFSPEENARDDETP